MARATKRDDPNHDQVWDWYWEKQTSSGSYFRVNMWGMGPLTQAMADCGALDLTPHPPWPDIAPDEWRDGEDNLHPKVVAVLAYEGDTPFIPSPKLGSNDGWIITETQAKASHDAMDAFAPEEVIEPDMIPTWERWVHFLDHVSSHGGAEVF